VGLLDSLATGTDQCPCCNSLQPGFKTSYIILSLGFVDCNTPTWLIYSDRDHGATRLTWAWGDACWPISVGVG
jgi:hypothetical protein